jgi:hypothetical protein
MSNKYLQAAMRAMAVVPASHPAPAAPTDPDERVGLRCNTTACSDYADAHNYNRVMTAFYCHTCRDLIDAGPEIPGGSLFPIPRRSLPGGGSHTAGTILTRPSKAGNPKPVVTDPHQLARIQMIEHKTTYPESPRLYRQSLDSAHPPTKLRPILTCGRCGSRGTKTRCKTCCGKGLRGVRA